MGGLGRGASFFAEKQAVVLNFGHSYTKVGLAAESRPRAIFKTPELGRRCRIGPDITGTLSHEEWVGILDDLLTRIFFQHLHLSPKDRRVVICDAVFSSASFRSALAYVLFKMLAVPAICFTLELVVPLYLTGLHSGLVVDFGYDAVRIMPTFAGVPVLSACVEAACGSRRLLAAIKRSLAAAGADAQALENESVLEDVLVCACYVACDFPEDGETPACSLRSEKDAQVRIPGEDKALRVPSAMRYGVTELFFCADGNDTAEKLPEEPSSAVATVQEAFLRCLELCPIDVRPAVVQNVVVIGGCATLRGLLPRVALEIESALRSHKALQALTTRLRFTPLDFAPICAAWTGAAVFGALEGAPDLSAEDYQRGKLLPDWLREGYV